MKAVREQQAQKSSLKTILETLDQDQVPLNTFFMGNTVSHSALDLALTAEGEHQDHLRSPGAGWDGQPGKSKIWNWASVGSIIMQMLNLILLVM